MVSRRKAKKAEKVQLKAQEMTLDEARKIVYQALDGVSVKDGDYKQALSLIEADDASFAAEIKDFIAKKAKEDELHKAYQIVGGYTNTISKNRYESAMKLVEADDAEFAAAIRELGCVSFANAKNDDLTKAELAVQKKKETEQYIKSLCTAVSNLDDVINDPQVKEALQNTPVVDDKGKEVSQDEVRSILAATAVNDVLADEIEQENIPLDEPQKNTSWIDKLKNAFKRNIAKQRVEASDGSIQGIKAAFNFKKRVRVSAKSMVRAFTNSYRRITQSISDFAKKGYNAAAAWLNKAKERTASYAIRTATFAMLVPMPACNGQTRQSGETENQPQVTVTKYNSSRQRSNMAPTAAAVVLADSVAADTINAKTNAVLDSVVVKADSVVINSVTPQKHELETTQNVNYQNISSTDSVVAAPVTFKVNSDTISVDDSTFAAMTSSSAPVTFKVNSDTISVDDATFDAMSSKTAAIDSVQIVADSDSVPTGTPAAGYVAERGGYENTGLISKRQDTNLKNWYVDKYGENAYEDVLNKITDDLLVKGGAFEGLSPKQALRIAEGIMVHAYKFPESAEALETFLNPCKDAQLTAEQAEQIRKDGYNITEEGLLTDGVYNKNVYARFYNTGDCEEDGHVVYEKSKNTGPTVASNRYYPRLYSQPEKQPVSEKPIEFPEKQPESEKPIEFKVITDTVEIKVTDSSVALEYPVYKGSTLSPEECDSIGSVPVENLTGLRPTSNTGILIKKETPKTNVTPETSETITEAPDVASETSVTQTDTSIHYEEGQTPLTNEELRKKHLYYAYVEALEFMGKYDRK